MNNIVHDVECLGYDGDAYFVRSKYNPQIQKMKAKDLLGKSLLRIIPLDYFGHNTTKICLSYGSDIISACHKAGIPGINNKIYQVRYQLHAKIKP